MHAPDQAGPAIGQAVAITGAALRFPGAADPPAFHALTAAGQRPHAELGRPRVRSADARAAAGSAMAAGTALAALTDLPAAVRPAPGLPPAGRIGVFLAGLPEPETAMISRWLHGQLTLLSPGDDLEVAAAGGEQPCSLRAVAAACEALSSRQFDLVLAGGVASGAGAGPERGAPGYPVSRPIRVYDASPTGMFRGEGCGVVALMRADDARAAGLPAYAEVAAWHCAGPADGQAVSAAYTRSGIDPAGIQYVEGHGAANADDDLAELSALVDLLGPAGGGTAGRCALGAVPATIGDTRSAAGIAALLRTVFAMTADTIPPATGCVRPHRLLQGKRTPFRLPGAAEQWPQTPVQLAAVNSLGTAPRPGAARSGPVHVVLRRERDLAHRPGRRRKPSPHLPAAAGGHPAWPR